MVFVLCFFLLISQNDTKIRKLMCSFLCGQTLRTFFFQRDVCQSRAAPSGPRSKLAEDLAQFLGLIFSQPQNSTSLYLPNLSMVSQGSRGKKSSAVLGAGVQPKKIGDAPCICRVPGRSKRTASGALIRSSISPFRVPQKGGFCPRGNASAKLGIRNWCC